MLKRTLLFTSPVYLSLKNEQLVVCFKDTPDDKRTIPIEDIGFVLIDNPMISITMPLVNALADNNVALIFCNEKSMPNAMLQNLDTHSLQCEILNKQIDSSNLVLEGGNLTTDGNGTLIAIKNTIVCQNRNPTLSQGQIEEELKRALSVSKIICLCERTFLQ